MTRLILALLLASSTAQAAFAQTWGENATMQLSAPTSIQYGAGNAWATKTVGPGAVVCNNATFGDAAPGVVKSCRVAGKVACLPKPLGTGSAALVKSSPKGDFAAWYCPGAEYPTVIACVKSACGLVGAKRAVAEVASNPTVDGLNAALKPFTLNPYTDTGLIAVWSPFAAEIRALVP